MRSWYLLGLAVFGALLPRCGDMPRDVIVEAASSPGQGPLPASASDAGLTSDAGGAPTRDDDAGATAYPRRDCRTAPDGGCVTHRDFPRDSTGASSRDGWHRRSSYSYGYYGYGYSTFGRGGSPTGSP